MKGTDIDLFHKIAAAEPDGLRVEDGSPDHEHAKRFGRPTEGHQTALTWILRHEKRDKGGLKYGEELFAHLTTQGQAFLAEFMRTARHGGRPS